MKMIFPVLSLGCLFFLPIHADPNADEISSYTHTKQFTFSITKEMLDRTPSWDGVSDLPYSIGKARAQALAEIGKLLPDSNEYSLLSI
ncbi:MAG TPA: hypothetical protein VHY09_01295, partial [Candidatus Methylacidiphilales bacterium]|nr:hypothetical protein [Candidatus Methylacidiphilales bacterium]